MECNMYYMFTLFYICINLSGCTVIPNCMQVSLYVIVRAHKLELASRAFIQRNEMKNEMKIGLIKMTKSHICKCPKDFLEITKLK